MYTIMFIAASDLSAALLRLSPHYQPHHVITSPNGPSDLANERWDGIDFELTKASRKIGDATGIELVLVGQINIKESDTLTPKERQEVDNLEIEMKDAKDKIASMIEHKTIAEYKLHWILVVVDHFGNEIHKIEDLSA